MNVSDFLIGEDKALIDAMALLDKIAKKVLFVERNNIFVATITDGDIRRWILQKGSLNAKVKDIANYNPKFVLEEHKHNAKALLKEYKIEGMPVLNENGKITSVIFLNEEDVESSYNLPVPTVIMAGGLGTRLYPYTKILPKPLIPIGEIPIVEHIINRFSKFGCNDYYLIVNHKKKMIKAYFNDIEKSYNVHYVDEDRPLGTGGGLSLLKGKIKSTFILSNCDILIEENYEKIYNYHKQNNNVITMVCSLKNVKIPYGVIDIGVSGEIENIKEKPQLSFFINTGMYIVEPRVVNELEENTSIGFPDIIKKYKDLGEKVGVFPIGENSWLDMGQLDELEEMRHKLECNTL